MTLFVLFTNTSIAIYINLMLLMILFKNEIKFNFYFKSFYL